MKNIAKVSVLEGKKGRRKKSGKNKKEKKKKRRNVFIHCKLKISQISSSQQTEDFYPALLLWYETLQYEQPHYSYLMTTFI